jgi:hypothetical protein
VKALFQRAHHNPSPELADRVGRGRARNKRRATNDSRNAVNPSRRSRSDDREEGDNQGSNQTRHGSLNAGVAVSTSVEFRCGLVMMKEAAYENDCQNRNNNQYLRRRANGAVAHCRRSIHGEIGAGITAQSTMPRQHTLHQSFKRRILGLTGLVLVASGERLPAGRDPPANQINLAGQDHSGRQSVPRLHQSCRCAARCALLRPAALTEPALP